MASSSTKTTDANLERLKNILSTGIPSAGTAAGDELFHCVYGHYPRKRPEPHSAGPDDAVGAVCQDTGRGRVQHLERAGSLPRGRTREVGRDNGRSRTPRSASR